MINTPANRRKSRQIMLKNVAVGGLAPITVQSMTKTDTRDVLATLNEIQRLKMAGCDIIRLAVPDITAAKALKEICEKAVMPVIADIHFDHLLALEAIKSGVHGLRLNPGNIRSAQKIKEVVEAAKDKNIPIRVGVNAGSLDPALKAKYSSEPAKALAESALSEVSLLEKFGFDKIKIAVKAFNIQTMTEAVKIVASKCDYPLHLGVTESGLPEEGVIRSSIGIGSLLLEGIGDTIRVSLTGPSIEEVAAGRRILKTLGLIKGGPVIVSCPTCGRCQIPLQKLAREVKERLEGVSESFQVAVMGCAVNGPGEASQADFGIAGGKDCGLLFKKGKIIKSLPVNELVNALIDEINQSLRGGE